jgi:hypothetical protein
LIEAEGYLVKFQVLFPLSEQVILGRDFLEERKAKIDFRKSRVKFGTKIVKTGKFRQDFVGIDLWTMKVDREGRNFGCQESKQLVKEYDDNIRAKGENATSIFGLEHKIELLPGSSIVNLRNYPMNLKKESLLRMNVLSF